MGSTSKSLRSLNNVSIRPSSRRSNWRKPFLRDAFCMDLQKGSYIAGIYSLGVSIFTFIHSIFDIYCLAEAQPGKTHYGFYPISFDFVYAGNPVVRAMLLGVAVLSLIMSLPLFVTSVILIRGLRKEHEQRLRPWLVIMTVFTSFRVVMYIFWSVLNDMMFSYHITMLVLWLLITAINIFCLLVVYSNYQDLSDITRLEDMAKLKMGTLSSLHTHASLHSMHSIHSMHSPSPKGSLGSA